MLDIKLPDLPEPQKVLMFVAQERELCITEIAPILQSDEFEPCMNAIRSMK